MGARIAARKGPVWSFLYNKWYFDELYDAIFVRGAEALGDLFWKGGDQKIIDGLGPDGVSAVSYASASRTGRLQTGYVYHYAFVMLIGVAGAAVLRALWASRGGLDGRHPLPHHLPAAGRRRRDPGAEGFATDEAAGRRCGALDRPGHAGDLRALGRAGGVGSTAPDPASSSSRTRPGSPACTTAWASTASRCCSCC
jgi:hypothetical protein